MTDQAPAQSPKAPRTALLAGGGLALVGLGLAAGLMMRSPSTPAPADAATEAAATTGASQAAPATLAETPANTATNTGAHPSATKVATSKSSPHKPKTTAHDSAQATDTAAAPAEVCANCGVIESVRAVQKKGEGSGLGAVAGGVLGGVVGNQLGKGDGKTALTVLGAIGGGLAGNEVEKRQRAVTVYEVRVRMDDGSERTVTQSTQPATGTRVEVEGQQLHPIGAQAQ